jgi:hypothetical protein
MLDKTRADICSHRDSFENNEIEQLVTALNESWWQRSSHPNQARVVDHLPRGERKNGA